MKIVIELLIKEILIILKSNIDFLVSKFINELLTMIFNF